MKKENVFSWGAGIFPTRATGPTPAGTAAIRCALRACLGLWKDLLPPCLLTVRARVCFRLRCCSVAVVPELRPAGKLAFCATRCGIASFGQDRGKRFLFARFVFSFPSTRRRYGSERPQRTSRARSASSRGCRQASFLGCASLRASKRTCALLHQRRRIGCLFRVSRPLSACSSGPFLFGKDLGRKS